MKPPASPRQKPFCLWRRLVRFIALVIGGFAALLVSCQGRLIYFPRPYQAGEPGAFQRHGGRRLDFTTGEGRQTAWLIPPRDGKSADRLWIVCGGNAAHALDMEDFCRSLPFPADAFLLVDYPGYGECEGSPHPSDIRESLRTVVPLAARELQIDPGHLPDRACVFGHSLGCAAALIAAGEFRLRSAVLCSPFTSTMDMAGVVLKLPLGFLVWHRFDNRAGLSALKNCGGHAWIFHGDRDTIVPAEMSRTLTREFPDTVTLTETPRAGHNDVIRCSLPHLIAAMGEARLR